MATPAELGLEGEGGTLNAFSYLTGTRYTELTEDRTCAPLIMPFGIISGGFNWGLPC